MTGVNVCDNPLNDMLVPGLDLKGLHSHDINPVQDEQSMYGTKRSGKSKEIEQSNGVQGFVSDRDL